MNCKPGDLAVVVMYCSDAPTVLGRVLRCVSQLDYRGHPVWETSPAVTDRWGRVRAVGDRALRPIRDPGDDAVDESKAWLPPVPLPVLDPSLLEVGK